MPIREWTMTRCILIMPRPIVMLLFVGLANCVGWMVAAVPAVMAQSAASAAATARAVDRVDRDVNVLNNRVDRIQAETMDTKVTLAALGEKVGGVIVRMDTLYDTILDVQRAQTTVILMALGFFVTISGALIGTLWSIRKGWLRTAGGD